MQSKNASSGKNKTNSNNKSKCIAKTLTFYSSGMHFRAHNHFAFVCVRASRTDMHAGAHALTATLVNYPLVQAVTAAHKHLLSTNYFVAVFFCHFSPTHISKLSTVPNCMCVCAFFAIHCSDN